MAIGRESTFLSLTDAANILVWNSVMDITKKKSTYNLMCSLDTHFPVNWLFKQKSFNNNENKVLHSFLKSSSIPYCVVRFWVWGKNLQLWTWHNFCYRHYTVKLFLHRRVRMRECFCLLNVNFWWLTYVRTDECNLSQAQLQVNFLFWLCW